MTLWTEEDVAAVLDDSRTSCDNNTDYDYEKVGERIESLLNDATKVLAREVFAYIASEHRLLPPGAISEEQYGVRDQHGNVALYGPRDVAERASMNIGSTLVVRTQWSWDDGHILIEPWKLHV